MKRLSIILLLVVFALQLGLAQDKVVRKPEAGQAYNEGLNLARKGKFEQAIPKFEKAVKVDNNFPQAEYMLGYCLKKTNDFNKAETHFRQAIKLNSKFEKAYVALGNLQAAADRKSEAINTFNAVLAINPKNAKANFGVGKIYFDLKKFKKAAESLQKAVDAKPKYVLAHHILGLTYKELKQFDKAANEFKLAIKYERKKSKKGTYYFQLGQVLITAKKYKAAEKALSSALKLSRKNSIVAGANFYMGELYKLTNRKQKALRYYQKATKSRSWKQSAEYEMDLIRHPDKYVN